MKHVKRYAIGLTLLMALSACSQGGTAPSAPAEAADPSETAGSGGTEAEAPVETSGKTDAVDPTDAAVEQPSYYGEWTVQQVAGSTPISTAVDEGMIGMEAVFSKEKASFGPDEVQNPVYEEAEMTNASFTADYRTPLSAIGIEADAVQTVSITDWTHPGAFLIVKDEETLITLWDGNFYELKRASS